MRSIEPLKSICGLLAAFSTAMLELRWLTPTPDAWAKLLAEQADAEAHGHSMCIYDPLPFIHSPAFYALVSAPTTLCALVALLIAAGSGGCTWRGKSGKPQKPSDRPPRMNSRSGPEERTMAKPSLACSLLVALLKFYALLLSSLMMAVLIAWLMVALSDGLPALMILLTAVLLLTFAVQMALLLAPSF
ncbi:MAG: hypothetical protein ACLQU2_17755 [Candidatus Binataceae bacterium]